MAFFNFEFRKIESDPLLTAAFISMKARGPSLEVNISMTLTCFRLTIRLWAMMLLVLGFGQRAMPVQTVCMFGKRWVTDNGQLTFAVLVQFASLGPDKLCFPREL